VNILAADPVNGPCQFGDRALPSDAIVGQTQILAEWGRRLAAQEPLRYVQVLPLFRRIVDEVVSATTLETLVAEAGQWLATLVGMRPAGRDAEIFIEGLTTARVLAWALHDSPDAAERLPALVLAALFQDVGRLPLAADTRREKERSEKRAAWLDHNHPAIGAAILGTIRDAPVQLALLVGQHHERLDGCGFPRGLAAREMLPDAAILAAATRFTRLCLGLESVGLPGGAGAPAAARAAQALLAESKWGMWPVEFATRLTLYVGPPQETVRALPSDLTSESAALPAEARGSASQAPDRLEASRHLHGREQGPPGLHIGRGRRLGEVGWYEKKMLFDRESR
jgi:hypothetical protein